MGRLQDYFIRDTRANQPDANTVAAGTVYCVIDEGFILEQSDGTDWNPFSPSGSPNIRSSFNPPVDSDFAWVNQGSSTKTVDSDSIVIIGAGTGSGFNLVGRYKTAPSPPYTITGFILAMMFSKRWNGYGLSFRDSASGRIHLLDLSSGIQPGASPTANYGVRIRSGKANTATSYSATYTNAEFVMPGFVNWFRIQDNNTNRIVSISADGINWLQLHSIGRTDFLTANQVGFHIITENPETPNTAPIIRLLDWTES